MSMENSISVKRPSSLHSCSKTTLLSKTGRGQKCVQGIPLIHSVVLSEILPLPTGTSGGIFGCHDCKRGAGLTSGEWGPGMQLRALHCAGQTPNPHTKDHPAQNAGSERRRNSARSPERKAWAQGWWQRRAASPGGGGMGANLERESFSLQALGSQGRAPSSSR